MTRHRYGDDAHLDTTLDALGNDMSFEYELKWIEKSSEYALYLNELKRVVEMALSDTKAYEEINWQRSKLIGVVEFSSTSCYQTNTSK